MKIFEKKLLTEAENLFNKENYEKALYNYSTILQENPSNRRAKILAILTEMVMNKEDGASGLYDYYTILQSEDSVEDPESIIESIIETMDSQSFELSKVLEEPIKNQLLYEDGITYEDFKEFAVKEKGFKRAFEDIVFTTKVIITERNDLIDFLNNLLRYGFYSVALCYLESALKTFPNDKKLQYLFNKIVKDREES